MDIELAVGIHKKDQFFRDCVKAGHQGRAVALVLSMVDEANAWLASGQGCDDFFCAVLATVVDDDDLELIRPL